MTLKYPWLVLDIDGVLTDGTETVPSREKRVYLRDLDALTAARKSGLGVAFLTGEPEDVARPLVERCGGGPAVYGAKDKGAGLRSLVERLGVDAEEVCYVGDGGRDVPALQLAGLGLAPRDGSAEACAAASHVLAAAGGRGAVEEAVRLLLAGSPVERGRVVAAVQEELHVAAGVRDAIGEETVDGLVRAVELMGASLAGGGKIVVFGEGDDASAARTLVACLVGSPRSGRRPLAALALDPEPPLPCELDGYATAHRWLERQVEALVRCGDVAVGLSTQGESESVARGLAAASHGGARTIAIAMAGAAAGSLGTATDLRLCFDAGEPPAVRKALHTAVTLLGTVVARLLAGLPTCEGERA